MDSGNQVASAISLDFFNQLGLPPSSLEKVPYSIHTAKSGETLAIKGRLKKPLCLEIEGFKGSFPVRPIVIQNLNHSYNVSGPFLRRFSIDHLHSTEELQWRRQRAPLLSLQDCRPRVAEAAVARGAAIPVYNLEKIRLKPGQTRRISAAAPGLREAGHQRVGRFHPETQLQDYHFDYCYNDQMVELDRCNSFPLEVWSYPGGSIPAGTLLGELIFDPEAAIGAMEPGIGRIDPLEEPDLTEEVPKTRKEKEEWLKDKFKFSDISLLNAQQKQKLLALLLDYWDVMSLRGESGTTDWVTHRINTGTALPRRVKCRPLNPTMEKSLKNQIDKWLEEGVIKECESSWAAALVPVKKKSGEIRWCCDL